MCLHLENCLSILLGIALFFYEPLKLRFLRLPIYHLLSLQLVVGKGFFFQEFRFYGMVLTKIYDKQDEL